MSETKTEAAAGVPERCQVAVLRRLGGVGEPWSRDVCGHSWPCWEHEPEVFERVTGVKVPGQARMVEGGGW